MKSKFFLVLLLCAISFASYSQVQFALGLKGGLNLSKFSIHENAAQNVNNRTGYHAGAFALIKITSFAIQPEVLFSKQGTKFTYNSTNYEANFDYIAVPVMFKFYLPLGLNLQAGPQFAFTSTKDLKAAVSGQSAQSVAANFKEKKDTSLALGAGWDLPFHLTIDARYVLGLSDMKFQPKPSDPVTFKNKVIMISVGYKFIKLGK
ncbi:MAG: porin family protein [Bacteroidota bacterium]